MKGLVKQSGRKNLACVLPWSIEAIKSSRKLSLGDDLAAFGIGRAPRDALETEMISKDFSEAQNCFFLFFNSKLEPSQLDLDTLNLPTKLHGILQHDRKLFFLLF